MSLRGKLATIAVLAFVALTWSFAVLQAQPSESTATIAVVSNGEFEQGLSGWQLIDSGVGNSRITSLVSHSGNQSLMIELLPTNMMTNVQIQGVEQSVSIKNLRDLTVEAWFRTTTCGFPSGVQGQLMVEVGSLAVNYAASATCGSWQQFQRDVMGDFRAMYGSSGVALFQRNGNVSVTIALELLRNTPDQIDEYWSMYWDDISASAQVMQEANAPASSLTTSSEEAVTPSSTSSQPLQLVQMTTTNETAVVYAASPFGQPPLQMAFGVLVGAVLTLVVIVGISIITGGSHRRSSESQKTFCSKCGSLLRNRADYCVTCGASVEEMKDHLMRSNRIKGTESQRQNPE